MSNTTNDTTTTAAGTAAPDTATARAGRSASAGGSGPSALRGTEPTRSLAPGVWVLPTQGNSLAVETAAGVVLVDAGPGGSVTAHMIDELRTVSDAPVLAIVYSHGHAGYNVGVPQWNDHAAGRGDPTPKLVAQAGVVDRYARYRETYGLQHLLHSMQFARAPSAAMDQVLTLVDPDTTFTDEIVFDDAERPVVVMHAPSETADAIAVWLPEQKILYGGAGTPGSTIPNIGTPLRTQRFTVRWAETLERLAELGAEQLVQEFGPVIEGADAVRAQLETTARALRWLRAEVVERMNRGMTDVEIIGDLDYPDELFDHPYMAQMYGARDYIVRDLFREENGWWTTRNPTDLHPADPDATAAAVASAVDPDRVVARARELADDGQTQLALAVIDLVALAPGDDAVTAEARTLKAQWCRDLANATKIYVSRSLYRASANALDAGHRRWSQLFS